MTARCEQFVVRRRCGVVVLWCCGIVVWRVVVCVFVCLFVLEDCRKVQVNVAASTRDESGVDAEEEVPPERDK